MDGGKKFTVIRYLDELPKQYVQRLLNFLWEDALRPLSGKFTHDNLRNLEKHRGQGKVKVKGILMGEKVLSLMVYKVKDMPNKPNSRNGQPKKRRLLKKKGARGQTFNNPPGLQQDLVFDETTLPSSERLALIRPHWAVDRCTSRRLQKTFNNKGGKKCY